MKLRASTAARVVVALVIVCLFTLGAVGFALRGTLATWWRGEGTAPDVLLPESDAEALATRGEPRGLEHLVRRFATDKKIAAVFLQEDTLRAASVESALDDSGLCSEVGSAAIRVVASSDHDAAMLRTLTKLVVDPDPHVRLAAMICVRGWTGSWSGWADVYAREAMAPVAPELVPVLVARVENGSAVERGAAAWVLETFPCDEAATRRLLWTVLTTETEVEDCRALLGESWLRAGLSTALAEVMEEGGADVRARAAAVLGGLRDDGPSGVSFEALLDDADPRVRVAALERLDAETEIGSYDVFIRAASDADESVRADAYRALDTRLRTRPATVDPRPVARALLARIERGDIGAAKPFASARPDDASIERLIACVDSDATARVRRAVASALGAVAPFTLFRPERRALLDAMVAALVRTARDADDSVRAVAIDALGATGPAASVAGDVLIAALDDPASSARDAATDALVRLGSVMRGRLDALVARLASDDAASRRQAARILGTWGLEAKPALDALLRALDDSDREVVKLAAHALEPIVAEESRVVSRLDAQLGSGEGEEADGYSAGSLLARVGRPAASAVSTILRLDLDEDDRVWWLAAVAPDDPRALQEIARVAFDSDWSWYGIDALAHAGPAAEPYVLQLADRVLAECRSTAGFDPFGIIADFLDGTHSPVAARALGAIGPDAATAVPALVRLLQVTAAAGRVEAALALGEIGARADLAVPALVAVLIERELRLPALQALERFGPAASDAVPAILPHLDDRDRRVREQVARVLGHLAVDAHVVAPALARALDDVRFQVRVRAAWALGEFGAAAAAHRDVLAKIARDDADPRVRWQARKSLARIPSG